MRVDKLELRNYRCFDNIKLNFNEKFNVVVGINGTGKTAILEALRISIGSLFLGVDKYRDKISSPGIVHDDVRLENLEPQFPVVIRAEGNIDEFYIDKDKLTWERSLQTNGGKTRSINAREMVDASAAMQAAIRNTETVTNIPLIAYYSTDRFKKEKRDVGVEPDGSRLRGYYNALDPLTNIKFFLDLWYTETLSDLQNGTNSPMLGTVREAIKKCINNCEDVKFDVKKKKLILTIGEARERIPFNVLSDGVRSMFAMVMEIAFRCYLLNPHLQQNAHSETSGIILIDEIDLHLHPEWQKRIINDLRRTFPKMQFIVSTHSPLVIGSLKDGLIFSVSDRQVFDFPLQYGHDANYVLNEMGTVEMDEQLKEKIERYFILIENGHGNDPESLSLRKYLEKELGENHTQLQRADMLLRIFF